MTDNLGRDSARDTSPARDEAAPAITDDILARLAQATVVDAGGATLGGVGQIYLSDADGSPTWVTVRTGAVGGRETLVPVHGLDVSESPLQVPYTAAVIKGAPSIEADAHISEDEERQLHAYYRSHGWDGENGGRTTADETVAPAAAGFAATQRDGVAPVASAGEEVPSDRPYGGHADDDTTLSDRLDPDRGADGGADTGAALTDPDRGADGGADAGAGLTDPDHGADGGADAGVGLTDPDRGADAGAGLTDPDHGADNGADAGAGLTDPDRGSDGGADAGAENTAERAAELAAERGEGDHLTERRDGTKEFDGIPVIDLTDDGTAQGAAGVAAAAGTGATIGTVAGLRGTDPDRGADGGADAGAGLTDPDHGADNGADAGAGLTDPDHGADGGADRGADSPAALAEARTDEPHVTEGRDGTKEFDGIPVVDLTDDSADDAPVSDTAGFTTEPASAAAPVVAPAADERRYDEYDDRRTSDADEVHDGGYGWGSAAPISDGAMPLGHPVRAWEDTRSYRQGPSPYLEREPDVWFATTDYAERAGFHQAENWSDAR